jgi:hypothetical protein
VIGSRGEGARTHQRRFLLGQGLVTQDHFRQVLGLPGVDPAVRAETELARHSAVDAVDLDLEASGDLFGREARVFALGLASRRVLAWGNEPSVDVTIIHRNSLSLLRAGLRYPADATFNLERPSAAELRGKSATSDQH